MFFVLKIFEAILTQNNKTAHMGGFVIFAQSSGLEPATSPVTGECSNQLSYDCNGALLIGTVTSRLSTDCVDEWNRTTV